MDTLYQDWLTYHFDRETDDASWHWGYSVSGFDAPPEIIATLLTRTLINSGTDLKPYSNAQVGMGLDFIFNPALSHTLADLQASVPHFEAVRGIIQAMKPLYADCLAPRCHMQTSTIVGGDNSLNHFCFMLWDVTSLSYWNDHPRKNEGYAAIVEVMEFALTLSNIACVESALHGLGHLHAYRSQEIEGIIRRFLRRPHDLPDHVKRYAEAAAIGHVN